jgi:hypothetical protein
MKDTLAARYSRPLLPLSFSSFGLILCLPIATASYAAVLGTTEAGWTLQEGGFVWGGGGSERYGLWLLKNSFSRNSQK